jgi:uncharacterized protein (TIGR03663 family)
MSAPTRETSLLDRPVFAGSTTFTWEKALFGLLVILAIVSRLYNLGQRVMSHDESLHTYFSWELYRGIGYKHDPMMHGPLQFHLLALTYFLFGVNDFTARLPHAIASILTVLALWPWRRYLGRAGTLIAALLMVISPYMLYYGRYARNEAFVALFGVLMLYAILRYLETGRASYLYLLTAATVLHFTAKETAFIYTAQALLFLAVYFVARLMRREWASPLEQQVFLVLLAVSVILLGSTLGLAISLKHHPPISSPLAEGEAHPPLLPVLIILTVLTLAAALILLVRGLGWQAIRAERSFDLLMLLSTLVLPQLSAFLVKAVGWDPLNYTFQWPGWDWKMLLSQGLVRLAICLVPMFLLSILLGLWWNKALWLRNAALFYAIFVPLYTTLFTNGDGFFSGMMGSLGYWLAQQGVNRGSQPWYYYVLVQIPIYEFLPALGLWLAAYLGWRGQRPRLLPAEVQAETDTASEGDHTFSLLFWWSLSSVVAFTIAGEKMPWLTVHITLPMILITGWGLGQLVERIHWEHWQAGRGWLVLGLLLIFITSTFGALLAWGGPTRPFAGKDLESLRVTASFLLSLLAMLGSAAGLSYLLKDWDGRQLLRLGALTFFGLLAVLTARAAFRAAYIEYDNGTEFLVYAHGARGVKDIMEQAEEISKRTTGGYGLHIAYDASAPDTGVSWPFVWYLRDYTNATPFDQPSRSLRDSPFIIVDEKNFLKIEPVVADNYYRFDYIRMVWPNQDYFNLVSPRPADQPFPPDYPCRGALAIFRLWKSRDFSRVCNYLGNPQLRAALFQIWLNRDYRLYATATGQTTLTPATWEPSDKMRLYIRKDVAAQIWNYGVAAPITSEPTVSPYEAGLITVQADLIFGTQGEGPGQFNAPRGLAIAPDGSLYVADSRNHRIQHFSAEGQFLGAWGSFSGLEQGQPALDRFNEPWGVAVSPDGQWVYVADTWNHRIVKFTANGQPVQSWGHANFGQSSDPYGFWGPRGLAVDRQGRVYVTDTGNKRVVIFDASGHYLTQFGQLGMEPGQFDEPVGIALDALGNVYVADTWNSRVQSFQPAPDGLTFVPLNQWPIAGWFGQSLDNKPYLAIGPDGDVFVTDPEMYRVLEFTPQGTFVRAWGEYGVGPAEIGLAAAVAVDAQGRVWVSDAGNHRLMRFTLPPRVLPSPTPTPTVLPLAQCQIPAEVTLLDLHACPDATCASVGRVPGGETLTLLPFAAVNGWVPVRWNDLLGWIPGTSCLSRP